VNGDVPEAPTVSVAVWPDVIVWLCGCVVIEGAVQELAVVKYQMLHPLAVPLLFLGTIFQ
jgi:hypothetical protein